MEGAMSRKVALMSAVNDPMVWEDILPGVLQGIPKVLPRLVAFAAGHGPAALAHF
jgi:hypothetical protein